MTLVKIGKDIPAFGSIDELNLVLKNQGCSRCNLGFQEDINGCCVSRGSRLSSKMLIGEAPGKDEDSTREPFTGPAGQLMDRIWKSVGMDTNDWYLTNVCLCRPVAPRNSGKQNLTPNTIQRRQCRPFLDRQIHLLQPKIIVTVGGIATGAILGTSSVRITQLRGKLIRGRRYLHFPMLHPAYLLHSKSNPERYKVAAQQMWDDIRHLKQILQEENLL